MRKAAGWIAIGAVALAWALGVLSPAESSDGEIGRASQVLDDGTPVTLYVPGGETVLGPGGVAAPLGEKYPLVVIAHGFVGDRVGLGFLADSLARNGYAVVTYDAPGHGENGNPFGSAAGPLHRTAMARVIDWAVTNRSVDESRIAVAGHSMGAATALDFASSDSRPKAVLAISGGWSLSGPGRPSNSLFIYASGDPGYLRKRVEAVAEELSGVENLSRGAIYGDPARGDAVALVEVPRTDHLSIIGSRETVGWLVSWLKLSLGGTEKAEAAPVVESRLVPARDARTAPGSTSRTYGILFILATVLAYFAGRVTGRVQRGTDWIPLDERFLWRRMVVLWGAALICGVVVSKVFGTSGAVPLGLLSGLVTAMAASGTVVAVVASYSKDTVVATAPRPKGMIASGVGGGLLLILLAGAASKLHNMALDPKRLVTAVLISAGLFPGFWGIEYLTRRGTWARSLASSALLKVMTLIAVALAVGIGAMHPVMSLGLPLLAGVFVYFEVFAVAAFRSGASPATIAAAEAVTLGWIGAALGPLQY